MYLNKVRDTMIKILNKENHYNIELAWNKNKMTVCSLISYYGSREYDFIFIKVLMDKIDFELFENNNNSIVLNKDEIKQLLEFIDVILKECQTWDEWSIITGRTVKELKQFKNVLSMSYPTVQRK